jgi:GNAT superfamily N-acetyltransferase
MISMVASRAMFQTDNTWRHLVRPARKSEIAAIAAVIAAAFDELSDQIPPVIFKAYVEESTDVAARWDEAEVLVAEIDGKIAGTVTYYADASREGLGYPSDWAGFRTLAADPAFRGRGVGRALLAASIDRAGEAGVPTLAIHTSEVMRAAGRLYEQAGFRRAREYDFTGASALGLDEAQAGHIAVIAYRLDFA